MNATVKFGNPSLLKLVNPRGVAGIGLACLMVGIGLGTAGVVSGLPLWMATAFTLALLAWPALLKWRADAARWGFPVAVLGALVYIQSFHTIEHIVQYIEYHLLQWHPRDASGLISAANVEIIHFVFNWAVLLTVIYLWRRGMRGVWATLLLTWTAAHTAEHTYLMAQYLQALQRLSAEGASWAFAQGLPGVLGRQGWLATSPITANTFLCQLPGVTTATRLDVHFWWNVGETGLLLAAGARQRCHPSADRVPHVSG